MQLVVGGLFEEVNVSWEQDVQGAARGAEQAE